MVEIDTPHGPARAHLQLPDDPRAALVLGHGAGGGIGARDLVAAAGAALAAGVGVVLVEQAYRVAGRRSPAPAGQLDTVWTTVVEWLRERELHGLPLVAGGRSSGARVACRTAAEVGATAVLCLAFPLHAPGRASVEPGKTRLPELEAVQVPVLIVQGAADPFGMPPAAPGREVVVLPGNHALTGDLGALATAVSEWLGRVVP